MGALVGSGWIQPEPFVLMLLSWFCVVFMFVLWRRRERSGAVALLVLTGGATIWSLAAAGELSATRLTHVVLSCQVKYLGVLSIPPAWLLFSLQFAQPRRRIAKGVVAALCVFPVVGALMTFSNSVHGLVWADTWVAHHGTLRMLGSVRGPFYWLIVAHAYVLLAVGTVILVRSVVHRHQLHRKQAALLLVMIVAPLSANLVHQLRLSPIPYFDLTPMAFTVCVMVLTVDFLRYGLLFSRHPISKDQIIQSMQEGVVVLGLDGEILDLNAAAQGMLGEDGTTLRGASVYDVLALPKEVRAAVSTGQRVTISVAPNAERAYEIGVSPYRARFAGVVGQVFVLRDVSSRHAAEAALHESEIRYRSLFNTMADGVFVIGLDGRIRDVNDSACRQLGYAREELQALSVWDVLSHTESEVGPILEALQTEGHVRFESEHVRRDGARIPVELHLSMVEYGRAWHILSIARDMSARKAMETELRRSEKTLSAIFHHSSNGILLTRAESGEFVDINRTMLTLLGYSREQVIGKNASELGLWADLADLEACNREYYSRGRVRNLEVGLRKDGASVPCLLSAETMTMNGERYALWEVRDHSAMKDTEAERERLRSQLFEAQKMESVGRLAGGIAHDFNNILAVILGYSELLEDELEADSHAMESVREITGAGQRARDLVRQLLAFGRKQVLAMKVLDLNEILGTIEPMLAPLMGEDVRVEYGFATKPVYVLADAAQLQQVVINLCLNARDAMKTGGVLRVRAERVTVEEGILRPYVSISPGRYGVLSVRDTGHGMDAETLNQIFDPFFTTKGVGSGTGLGLATVFGIVKQHGGEIDVESEAGRGTTFLMYLPEYRDASVLGKEGI